MTVQVGDPVVLSTVTTAGQITVGGSVAVGTPVQAIVGPPGPAGGSATVHTQTAPAASWSISHALGRLPTVVIYVAGEQCLADIAATANSVTVTFAEPTAGVAVIT